MFVQKETCPLLPRDVPVVERRRCVRVVRSYLVLVWVPCACICMYLIVEPKRTGRGVGFCDCGVPYSRRGLCHRTDRHPRSHDNVCCTILFPLSTQLGSQRVFHLPLPSSLTYNLLHVCHVPRHLARKLFHGHVTDLAQLARDTGFQQRRQTPPPSPSPSITLRPDSPLSQVPPEPGAPPRVCCRWRRHHLVSRGRERCRVPRALECASRVEVSPSAPTALTSAVVCSSRS